MQRYEHQIDKSNMVDSFSHSDRKADTGDLVHPIYIYTLSDITGIRYVGQTNDPRSRLSRHRYNSSSGNDVTPRGVWLKECNQNFSMALVEKCHPFVANEREQFWISFFVDQGCTLLNRESKAHGLSAGNAVADCSTDNAAPNTKERNAQLAKTARSIINQFANNGDNLRPLLKEMMRQTGCNIDTAKRHIKRQLSGMSETEPVTRGGAREGGGRPKKQSVGRTPGR